MHNIKLSINCILTHRCLYKELPALNAARSPTIPTTTPHAKPAHKWYDIYHKTVLTDHSVNPPTWLTKYVVPPHSPGAAISPLAQRETWNARWLEKRRSRRPFKIITLNMQISEEPRRTPAKTLGKVDYAQSVWADESLRSLEEKKLWCNPAPELCIF